MATSPTLVYCVGLSNGLESCYTADRALAARAFLASAEIGRCYLVAIKGTWRHVLASSVARDDAVTLGAYSAVMAPYQAEALALERKAAKPARRR